MDKYYIKSLAFEKIFEFLNGQQGIYCKNRDKTQKFLEAVYFIMRTGSQWEELPKEYGKYKSVQVDTNYNEYSGWLLNSMIRQSSIPKKVFVR